MPKTYTRLTKDERYQIYEDKFTGFPHRQIVQKLNLLFLVRFFVKGLLGYRPRQAHQWALQRNLNKPKGREMTNNAQKLIINQTRQMQ